VSVFETCVTDESGACVCNDQLARRIHELEAQAAAMREAWKGYPWSGETLPQVRARFEKATAPDAGKRLLERLERAESLVQSVGQEVAESLTRTSLPTLDVRELARSAAAEVRARALEDAAKVAEAPFPRPTQFDGGYQAGYSDASEEIANAIRALKGTP
jgi:hypothetical protein